MSVDEWGIYSILHIQKQEEQSALQDKLQQLSDMVGKNKQDTNDII